MISARKPHGAVLSFIVAAIFVVVLLGIAFASLLMLMGGSRQGTNANDAGNLNVAKCAPLVRVAGGSDGDPFFLPIAADNMFDLTNINDVWGKTLLVCLNEEAMRQQGASTSLSSAAAGEVWTHAQAISSRLTAALNTRAKLEGFHQSVAHRNRVNMLTPDRSVDVTGKWRTSCMNRETESNMLYSVDQLPPGISVASLPIVKKIDPKTGKDVYFWMGYKGIKAAGRFINFVPFEYGGAPHHVSLKTFVANTLTQSPMPTWTSPVPNAFESKSSVEDAGLRHHTFDAAALSHVKERALPKIEDGFIRFRLGEDSVTYKYMGIFVASRNPLLKRRWLYSEPHLVDPTLPTSYFELLFDYGHQYADPAAGNEPTLYKALFATRTDSDSLYRPLKTLLMNRVKQIKPGTEWPEIASLLHSTTGIAPRASYILRLDGSKQFVIEREFPNSGLPPADGRPLLPAIEDNVPDPSPNRLHYVIHHFTVPPAPHGAGIPKRHETEWTHRIDLIPGSGAHKALLDVNQDDDAVANFHP